MQADNGVQDASAIATASESDAETFADSILGLNSTWASPLVAYRLASPFQRSWKVEVGRWLLFAQSAGFLPQLQHLINTCAKKVAGRLLPSGDPDPNDGGHRVLNQVLAQAQVAYYLARNGWSFGQWEPPIVGGDVDLRMETQSHAVADLQVKAGDQPGQVVDNRIADGEFDDRVRRNVEDAIRQIGPAPGPARLVVVTPQRIWPMSADPSPIVSLLIGRTVGDSKEVTLARPARGLFASTDGARIHAAMILDCYGSLGRRFYSCCVLLNPWAANQFLTPDAFPAAAVCELGGDRFVWHRNADGCFGLPPGTRCLR